MRRRIKLQDVREGEKVMNKNLLPSRFNVCQRRARDARLFRKLVLGLRETFAQVPYPRSQILIDFLGIHKADVYANAFDVKFANIKVCNINIKNVFFIDFRPKTADKKLGSVMRMASRNFTKGKDTSQMCKSVLRKSMMAIAAAFCVASTDALAQASATDVIEHYADIAEAKYSDSLAAASMLHESVDTLLADPSHSNLERARSAWLSARIPYQQTEVYRFGNAIVDDWEGRVNAWPLDEGLIDYVDAGYGIESDENSLYTANIIANASFTVDGRTVDASRITTDLLQNKLQEAGGIEANVATGYHAIEFLLWGQDLNGTEAGAGDRRYTDFSLDNCTNGNCDRRREYLAVATDLLVSDLEEMVANWNADGAARKALEEGSVQNGLRTILTGMGSLSYGELAGERMKLGLLLGDPEEEHDCFSDNTHNSHYYDAVGIQNVYLGTYERIDGTSVTGPSISGLIALQDARVNDELTVDLQATIREMEIMVARAENGEAYDQMIASGNEEGNAVVQAAIDALIKQAKSIERAIASLELGGIDLEGSDSLDDPDAVFE